MIMFSGISVKDNVRFLNFQSDSGESVSIPIDPITAERISKYLSKISLPASKIEKEEDV